MADAPDKPEKPAQPAETPAHGLRTWERVSAFVLGLLGVGAGGVGVFLSDNQAGTTAILLLGAVFLLMGVQGTAIIRAGKDSVELERRRAGQKVLERAEERAEEDPDTAAELVAAAKSVDPALRRDPAVWHLSGFIYEQDVARAVTRICDKLNAEEYFGPHSDLVYMTQVFLQGYSFDGLVTRASDSDTRVGIETKNLSGSMTRLELRHQAKQIAEKSGIPIIMVTNHPAYKRASPTPQDPFKIEYVLWRDERDDANIETALRTLLTNLI